MKTLLLLFLSLPLFAASLVIDCGSPSDQYFSGGLTGNVVTSGATGDISVRYGTFSYKIPAPAGASIVTLVFRETGTVLSANQRKFTVKFNEQPAVLDNFDLYAVAGLNSIRRDFQVFSIDGFINIYFTYSKKAAVVSSIEVAPWTSSSAIIRQRELTVTLNGTAVVLPETPLTSVQVFWGGLFQPLATSNYSVSGNTVTFSGWPVGDQITFVYYY